MGISCSCMAGEAAADVAQQLAQLSLSPAKQHIQAQNAVITGNGPALSALRELIGDHPWYPASAPSGCCVTMMNAHSICK